jgi:hypothetical protein
LAGTDFSGISNSKRESKKTQGLKVTLNLKGGRPVSTSEMFYSDAQGRVLMRVRPDGVLQPRISRKNTGWIKIFSITDFSVYYNPYVRRYRVYLWKKPLRLYHDLYPDDMKLLVKAIRCTKENLDSREKSGNFPFTHKTHLSYKRKIDCHMFDRVERSKNKRKRFKPKV